MNDTNAQPGDNPEDNEIELTGYEEEGDPLMPTSEIAPELQAQEDAQNEGDPQINALQLELDKTKDQLLRALAEAENTRRRAAKEREDASKFAISGFARDILSVADNLRRAMDAIPDDAMEDVRIKNLFEGIEGTEKELLRTFERNGIEKLEPLEEAFDPNFHEVMFETPGTGKPNGIIIQVLEPGYVLKGRLLRPARVGVAKGDASDGGNEAPDTSHPGGTINTEA